jgi:transcriptional regulator with XRE-family HTH domain
MVKRLREQRGMSQNALAKAIHHDRSYLSKALRGVKPCGPALARLIDSALDANGEIIQAALRSRAPGDLVRSPVSSLPSVVEGEDSDDPLKRREFGITALGMLAAGLLPPPGRVPTSVSAEHVRRLREAAAGLWVQDWQVGSAVLLDAVGAYATARAMLDDSRYSSTTGNDLLAVTAELAACAGFIAFDAAEQATARVLLTEAALLATSAGDQVLIAHAYSLLALQSSSLAATGRQVPLAREALRFLGQGADAARHVPSPRVHAVIAMRRATACALLGEEQDVRTFIAAAHRELDAGGHPSDPHWAAFVTPAEVTAHEAMAYLSLGQPARAVGVFRAVLADKALPRRNRVYYQARLAGALNAVGDHSQSLSEGLQALPGLEGPVKSPRTLLWLRPVRQGVSRDSEFAGRFDAVAAS